MTREQVKQAFNLAKDNFDSIQKGLEIVDTKYAKCEYFEIFPYSYQRNGFKKGKLIKDINKERSTKDLYSYSFDSKGRIIQVEEGISIENQFYVQFLRYEEGLITSLKFDNTKVLINIRYYFLDDKEKRIERMVSKGKRGGRDEFYNYSENGFLKEIQIKQYDRRDNEADPYKEVFEFTETGELLEIIKSFGNGYSEVIYELSEK